MQTIWAAIERAPASAAAVVWKRCFGRSFDAAVAAFLRKTDRRVGGVSCVNGCGCSHRVVSSGRGFVAVCDCDEPMCDDFRLDANDIAVWELSRDRLGRAIARALGCDPHVVDFAPHAVQVGSFGAASLPVMLVSASEPEQFQAAVTDLVARLNEHFVVLAPTRRFFNSAVQELISRAKAGFIALEPHLRLTSSGAFQSDKTAGDLFSPYLPNNNAATTEAEAQKVFRLAAGLEDGKKWRKAPLLKVLRLLVVDGQTQEAAARACGCVPSLITVRAKELERRMGMSIDRLRAFGSRLGETGIGKDDRARTLHGKSASA